MKDIPKELLEGRERIECNFVLSLYLEPDMIPDYKNIVNGEDVITEDGQFYYGLAKGMYDAGYSVFDHMAIYSYLEDKKTLKDGFERRGGMATINEITGLLNLSNLPKYYDDLCKSNLLIRLNGAGFDVLTDKEKFSDMSSEDVYDYFEYQLANISIGRIEKIRSEDLTTDYDKWISEWDKGGDIGFRIGSKMLNYQLVGVHKKNLLLHLAGIGIGKTSSAIAWYVLPTIETQDICIIANEQDVSAWRQMILSTVLFSKIGYPKGFDRHKMLIGNYTDEQKEMMKQAATWLESQPGRIIFIETQDYGVANIKKVMTKWSKRGVAMFLVDTLKPLNDASDKAWGEFSEVAKELFLQAKRLDVAVVATCQLSPDAMSRRYLDLTCIAKARAVAETASSVVMFRPLTREEREKVKPYGYENKIKRITDLDPDKDYIMVFTPKNRYGNVAPQIIMERNMSFNTYRDIGWYECEYDQFRTR